MNDPQWAMLSKNDWSEILELSQKRAFRRKFAIVEQFTALVAAKGFHRVTHADIAVKCGVARQLIGHHFPKDELLIGLSYRFVYARFQKAAADAVIARVDFRSRLNAYAESVATWVTDYPNDARFLVQFYALISLHPELSSLHQRNTRIGQERIAAICKQGQASGYLQGLNENQLLVRATAVQKLLIGTIVLMAAMRAPRISASDKAELTRSVRAILGIS